MLPPRDPVQAPAPAPPTASGITQTPAARSDRPNPTREQNGKPEPGGNGVDPCRTSPREREIRRSGERPLDPDREGGRVLHHHLHLRRGGAEEPRARAGARRREGGRAGGRLIRASLSPPPFSAYSYSLPPPRAAAAASARLLDCFD